MSRHAVITGGGTGIGAAISRALAGASYQITVVGRRIEPLSALCHEIGESAFAVTADVSDPESVTNAFSQARDHFGPITVLVNCAGQAPTAPFRKTQLADWQAVMGVNLDGVFNCTQAVLDDMLANGWGRVINIASTASLKGYPYVSAYCAAKHGVLGLTRALALELATKGVTVNAICPGFADTDIIAKAVDDIVQKTGRTPEQALSHFTASNPQGRLVQPAEVAASVLWLASDQAGAVNGQAIAIDGGESA